MRRKLSTKTKREYMAPYTPAQLNPNNALNLIKDSLSEANNPTVSGTIVRNTSLDRGVNESIAAYNLRVAPGNQPVQPHTTKNYMGGNL
jgi:hypothetical protein